MTDKTKVEVTCTRGQLRIDANGHQLVHHDKRGLRLCEVCNLVMSEGWLAEDGDAYACSDKCFYQEPWLVGHPITGEDLLLTREVIATWDATMVDAEGKVYPFDDLYIYFTDWEGDGRPMPEEVAARLLLAPYNLTADDIHKLGAHEDDADLSCKACSRLHRYEIPVPTSIDRKYRVTAESEDQALEMYHTGADGVVFEEDDSSNAHEIEDEATVEEIG